MDLKGTNGNDQLMGTSQNDLLDGGTGNDWLDGGTGNDSMVGGADSDTYVVNSAGDVVTELTNEGTDTVQSSITYTLGANVENLTLTGTAAINGTGNTLNNVITGNSGNNSLSGAGGNDTLYGGAGNDALDGGDGNDSLDGGAGNDSMAGGADSDSYVVDGAGDVVTEAANEGTDTVQSSITYTLGANVENLTLTGSDSLSGTGNTLNNVITGNDGNNSLSGSDGNDLLYGGLGNDSLDGGAGNDTLSGGGGDDIYVVDSTDDVVTEMDNGGTDIVRSSISYTLGEFVEKLTLTGSDSLSGTGNALDNVMYGNTGNNVLSGGDGNDTMYGGTGNDTLIGGAGNDGYIIDSIDDVIVEYDGEGTDYVAASYDYTLLRNFEKLQLLWFTIKGTGNELNNVIYGNLADNVLDGGAGDDTLYGGKGNDTYVVDSVGDIVDDDMNFDAPNDGPGGTDSVLSSVTFTLSTYIENLTLTGSANRNGTGNALNNVITGNSGDNLLDGGTGNDTMIGGSGNDTYVVDSTNDVVTELDEVGTDTVQSSISYSLGAFVENLTLTGNDSLSGIGNALNNVIMGNSGDNVLDGGAGDDTLDGGAGNDALDGGDGNDSLDGGAGNDTLSGGGGNDIYVVDSTGDVVTEMGNGGTDTVKSWISYTLGDNLERLTLAGSASNGTGNALDNVIFGGTSGGDKELSGGDGNDALYGAYGGDTLYGGDGDDYLSGNDGNDYLSGNDGSDRLIGGSGNDTYVVDSANDVVTELDEVGTDTVQSSISYTLLSNFENLTLTGSANLNGTGNTLSNVITGNSGNNSLSGAGGNDTLYGGAGDDQMDGGAGNDRMVGGYGNDSYEVDSINDAVVEVDGEGTDLVHSSITYTLDANVENLTLMGSDAINGTGNAAKNTILGNHGNNALYGNADNDTLLGRAGNDTLDGGEGDDALYGGGGDDTYVVDSSVDTLSEIDDDGTDTVQSSITYTLGANVENLTLTGSDSLSGTGNTLNNVITGNDGDNDLSGYAGNDSLVGGAGNDRLDGGADADQMAGGVGDDTYVVDATADSVSEDNDAGKDTVQSSIDYELRDNFENLVLTGSEALSGAGNALDNAITGNDANNVLSGGAGSDTLSGGKGDDTYIVTDALDTITEAASSGFDTVQSTVNYTLGLNLETLVLTGNDALIGKGNELANTITGDAADDTLSGLDGDDTLYGNNGNDYLFGGAGTDVLYGGDGDDVLNGGTGTDSMTGGDGDDTYYVERSTDKVIETGSTGHDIIYSSINFTLDALLEDLTLTGTKGLKGIGNDLDNTMTGNAGNNFMSGNDGSDTLNGNDGADTLNGGAGTDQLDGGTGADRLVGGDGNDTYFVDDAKDVVVEKFDKGSDLVKASVSYTVLANIEVLELTGNGSINGTGNVWNNKVIGNSGENVLKGLGGDDTLDGGDGNDILIGGFGNDILTGGVGADSFVFERTRGIDHITDFTSGVDHVNLATALVSLLGGTSALTDASFYAAADAVTGHDANDRLIYNTTTGALYYDVDGSGKKAAVQIATLDLSDGLAPTLLYSDFTFG